MLTRRDIYIEIALWDESLKSRHIRNKPTPTTPLVCIEDGDGSIFNVANAYVDAEGDLILVMDKIPC